MSTSYLNNTDKEAESGLIRSYKTSGSLDVLAKIYRPYMPLVYGVALKYFKDEDRSKDAVMEVFELLIEKLKTQEVNNFKSWLYVVCKNHCLMALRVSQRNTLVSLEEGFMEYEPFLHPDNVNEREDQLNAMEKCIETLNDEQKTSIRLFYIEQNCYNEVAEKTGYDIKKVKSYIQNGKRNLKICIENSGK